MNLFIWNWRMNDYTENIDVFFIHKGRPNMDDDVCHNCKAIQTAFFQGPKMQERCRIWAYPVTKNNDAFWGPYKHFVYTKWIVSYVVLPWMVGTVPFTWGRGRFFANLFPSAATYSPWKPVHEEWSFREDIMWYRVLYWDRGDFQDQWILSPLCTHGRTT